MRRVFPFILFLAALSLVSGWLMGHMSWFGRMGVTWVYSEYGFLKVWYKGAAVVFAVLLVLFGISALIHRYMPRRGANLFHILVIAVAGVGLYYTYEDFRHTITHRWMRENFHLGAYLFWIGWMSISVYFLAAHRQVARQSLR